VTFGRTADAAAYNFITEQTQQHELVGKKLGKPTTWKDGTIQLGSG
jgi:hypothetical protein